jgi:hypothetical protein
VQACLFVVGGEDDRKGWGRVFGSGHTVIINGNPWRKICFLDFL